MFNRKSISRKITHLILREIDLVKDFHFWEFAPGSGAVETVTFETETETQIKLGDRGYIKILETRDLKFETESGTRDFQICAFCRKVFKTCCHHF